MKKDLFSYCLVVDLDFTLVPFNSTYRLVKYQCFKRYLFLFYVFLPFTSFVLYMLNKITSRDILKLFLIRQCSLSSDNVKYALEKVLHDALRSPLLVDMIEILRESKGPKILLTASLDLIAKKFLFLGFQFVIGSKFQCDGKKCFILTDIYGKKHKILEVISKYCKKIIIIEDSPEPKYYFLRNIKIFRVVCK